MRVLERIDESVKAVEELLAPPPRPRLDIDSAREHRAIVTGGAGFIGSHVVDALLAEGHEVTVVDDLSREMPAGRRQQAELRELDIVDLGGLRSGRRGARAEGRSSTWPPRRAWWRRSRIPGATAT